MRQQLAVGPADPTDLGGAEGAVAVGAGGDLERVRGAEFKQRVPELRCVLRVVAFDAVDSAFKRRSQTAIHAFGGKGHARVREHRQTVRLVNAGDDLCGGLKARGRVGHIIIIIEAEALAQRIRHARAI